MSRLESLAAAVVVTFWLATSAFALLASVPFAHEQFLMPRLVPGLLEFAEWHPWAAVVVCPIAAVASWRLRHHPRAGMPARLALGLSGAAAVVLPLAPPIATLQPDGWAVAASLLALAAPLAHAATDLRAGEPWPESTPQDRTAADAVAVALAALAITATYAAWAWTTQRAAVPPLGAAASLVVHAVFAAAVFLCLTLIRGIAAGRRAAGGWEFWLAALLVAGVFQAVAHGVILPSLSLTGWGRRIAAAALAFTLAAGLVGRGRRRSSAHGDGIQTAFGCFVLPLVGRRGGLAPTVGWLATVVVVATGSAAASAVMDWSFVLARTGAVLAWLVAVSGALALPRPTLPRPTTGWSFAGCLAVLALHQILIPRPGQAAESAAERWAVVDPSYRLLREVLRPPASADAAFYPFLQRHTNLGPDVRVDPIDVRLARLDGPAAARRPHIFLLVVDSLRRDYLSPYNDAVDFTPAIDRFARESVVFERAFTRYGATGLSVPSIWVGGMIPHKQYVRPFAPLNALHHLLAHERYTRWISWDNVVDATVPREPAGPALDAGTAVKDFRFCDTVAELLPRLDGLAAGDDPAFVWTLPQDLHIAAITREGKRAVDASPYQGFHAPYASRVRKLDACFGALVDRLKARGLYDDSIVILTADHGDSLGEDGRWGHAYTLFPEILQVPLVVHVPEWFRATHVADPAALAFTTDITPTLYAVLGHTPSPPASVFGQPLFRPKEQRPSHPRTGGHLVASSYGSVYGWLAADGRRLYVADGVDFRDYVFALDGSAPGRSEPVTADERHAGQQAIRDAVDGLARFYGYDAGGRH
jgi:hypothetical protein